MPKRGSPAARNPGCGNPSSRRSRKKTCTRNKSSGGRNARAAATERDESAQVADTGKSKKGGKPQQKKKKQKTRPTKTHGQRQQKGDVIMAACSKYLRRSRRTTKTGLSEKIESGRRGRRHMESGPAGGREFVLRRFGGLSLHLPFHHAEGLAKAIDKRARAKGKTSGDYDESRDGPSEICFFVRSQTRFPRA